MFSRLETWLWRPLETLLCPLADLGPLLLLPELLFPYPCVAAKGPQSIGVGEAAGGFSPVPCMLKRVHSRSQPSRDLPDRGRLEVFWA